MFSVLIPIYNFDATSLVEELTVAFENLNVKYEVICIDDASVDGETLKKNRELDNYPRCNYIILKKNIGRSKIRNLLASKAKYDNLLFLDCDVMPFESEFIKNYIMHLNCCDLVYGGLAYPSSRKALEKNLHYKYGKSREAKSFLEREKSFKNIFTTANFLIKKDVFEAIKFEEAITTYGFEDIVFAKKTVSEGFRIQQIDNPVVHMGYIKNNYEFVKKKEQSLFTLKMIYEMNLMNEKDSKVLFYHKVLKKMKLIKVYNRIYYMFKKRFLKNLSSDRPSLFILDVYSLGYFNELCGY